MCLTNFNLRRYNVSKGVFVTTLAFTDEGLSFTPPREDVLSVMNNTVIEGMISLVQAVPRLLYMRVFAGFFDGVGGNKNAGLNPVSIVRSTEYFQKLVTNINQVIADDFAAADEYVKIFEDQRVIFDFGKTWDVEEYRTKERDLGTYRQDMNQQRDWKVVIERLKIGHVVGVLNVDSRPLRNSLLPITLKTIDDIKVGVYSC
jgi:dynein heavy chain